MNTIKQFVSGFAFAVGFGSLGASAICILAGCSARVEGVEDAAPTRDATPASVAPSGSYVVTYDSTSACATPSHVVEDSTGVLSPYVGGTSLAGGWTCTDSVAFTGPVESVDRTCALGASMSFRVYGTIVWSSADDGVGTWTDVSTSSAGSCTVSISAVYSRAVE
jgi:hypothetical protein